MSKTETVTAKAERLRLSPQSVPDWLAALFLGRPKARALSFGDVKTLNRRNGNLIAPANWLDPRTKIPDKVGRGFVDVVLPSDCVLKRTVHLPTTPRRMIGRAIQLDMLRRTPFKVDQVYSTVSDIEQGNTGTRLIHWIARRDEIEDLRARLADAGFKTRYVIVAGTRAAPIAGFTAQTFRSGRFWRALNVVSVAALFAAAVWIWVEPALQARNALHAQTLELQSLTKAAVALRQVIDAQGDEQSDRNAFLQRMTRRTLMVTTLRSATVMLPDTAWITDMAIDRDRVVVRGSTAGSAAQMLLDLPTNRFLRDPELAGPVSQTADARERFEIIFQTQHEAQ